ncbi:MAG: hypothetical protein GY849_23575, partial [Deltaproteobacteria bacterium]|nr:hypothetical protein [Deltaproteobacteria bacterium]
GNDADRSSATGLKDGWQKVSFLDDAKELFKVNKTERVWQHHFDEVIKLPEGSIILASNPHTKIQAYLNYDQHLLGTQFHPEFDLTSGNKYFLKDRDFIEQNSFCVDEMLKNGPTFETGKIFFDFFLTRI